MSEPPIPLQRLRVSDGLLINSDRWQIAHNYHRQRQNLLYQALFTGGIVSGLGVSAIAAPKDVPAKYRDGRWVCVGTGIAIDGQGNFIIVAEAMEFRITSQAPSGESLVVYLVISHVDPETLLGNGAEVMTETFRINEKSSPPTATEIELCRICLGEGDISISAPADPFSPQLNQLDLRHRPRVQLLPAYPLTVCLWDGEQSDRWQSLAQAMPHLYPPLQIVLLPPEQWQTAQLVVIPNRQMRQLNSFQMDQMTDYLKRGGVLFSEFSTQNNKLGELLRVQQELTDTLSKLGTSDDLANLRRELSQELDATRQASGEQIRRVLAPYQNFGSPQPLTDLSPSHPLRSQPFLFSTLPQPFALPLQIWTSPGVIALIGDLSLAWSPPPTHPLDRHDIRSAQELGANLLQYAYQHHHIATSTK